MGRTANLSPLGLYNWDETVFDLMVIPDALDRDTLIDNLLLSTAELEVLYPDPRTFKQAVGMWSRKEIGVWNKLYDTTQYEYNPIENYNRMETGETAEGENVTHSGTDTTTDSETQGGSDTRSNRITLGGSDTTETGREEGGTEAVVRDHDIAEGGTQTVEMDRAEGGTQTVEMDRAEGGTQTLEMDRAEGGRTTNTGSGSSTLSGQDTVADNQTLGHFVAGFESTTQATEVNDGLVKQTRDMKADNQTTTYGKKDTTASSMATDYGRTEDNTDTTRFGKTEDNQDTIHFGKTEDNTDTTRFGKTVADDQTDTTTFGKTEDIEEKTTYGRTEQHNESVTHGGTLNRTGSTTHGEQISTDRGTEHTLHAHGNIGVTTTQQLIKEEREIDRFNLYDFIIDSFKMRFCVLVY